MARLLQNSNQPTTLGGTLSGAFACCFKSPRRQPSPVTPAVPAVRILPPRDDYDERKAEGESTSITSKLDRPSSRASSQTKGSRPGSQVLDSRKSSLHQENQNKVVNAGDMYNSWMQNDSRKVSDSRENLPLSVLASQKLAPSLTSSQSSHLPSPMNEFTEQQYTKTNDFLQPSDSKSSAISALHSNATIHTNIGMNFKTSELTIKIINAQNAPTEDEAGSASYQVRIAILGLKKKKRWHSGIAAAPDPVFNEAAVFKGLTPDELAKSGLRIRLYGCRKMRRSFILAESIVPFSAINLHSGQADIPFALASKVGHGSVVDSDSDTADNLSRLHASNMGSRLSLNSRTSRRSMRSFLSTSRGGAPSVASTDLPQLETARQVAEGGEANWPEILCGLAYNATTKRLNIHILRTNRLRVPEAAMKSPKAFASLTLVSETGEKINSSHTHEMKLSSNMEFNEKFAFDMSSLNPREVTLFVRVFQKRHLHTNEGLGWFAIGLKNTGEEERNHWNEMLQAQGQEITRWHVLNENIT